MPTDYERSSALLTQLGRYFPKYSPTSFPGGFLLRSRFLLTVSRFLAYKAGLSRAMQVGIYRVEISNS